MISLLLAAALAPHSAAQDVAFEQLAEGRDAAAIVLIEGHNPEAGDPARLINLGIAYARRGETEKARSLFEAAYHARDRVELETATGEWVDSRMLARQAIAMLDRGQFAPGSQIARN